MGLPDNFNTNAFNKAWSSPFDVCPEEANDLGRVHNVWEDTLNAFAASCIKNLQYVSKGDIELLMEGVSNALDDVASDYIRVIEDKGFQASTTPDDSRKLIDAAHERIVDAFRPKKLDVSAMLRPVLTNPQTYADIAAQNVEASKSEGL